MKHVLETDLALLAAGDLPVWPRFKAALHVRSCEQCRALVEAYRADRDHLHAGAQELPEGLDWDRLSAEMSANIHLGLAAGECVSPRETPVPGWNWRPAAAVAALLAVMVGAWWLNMPQSDTSALGRIYQAIVHGGPRVDAGGPFVEASHEGIEFVEGGTSLGMALTNEELLTTTVSAQGSASARYVDNDTVTINTLYVQ